MDFFEHQDRARQKTVRLVVFFVIAVLLIVISVNFAVAALLSAVGYFSGEANPLQPSFTMLPEQVERLPPPVRWWRPELYGYITFGTLAIIFGGSAHKIAQLAQGGQAVARMLGGTPLTSATDAADERQLLNVVEEMSIASGVPMPAVYVLNRERSINAFAAGFSTSDAVIGVTRGTIDKLTRDELQGVIAHEFSHILNGDMRLNVRLIGLLHGIFVIGLIGYTILRHAPRMSSGNRKNGGGVLATMLLGLVIMIIGYAGLFFGRLIQAAVSRQREFLADASAVQFTRNPGGIAGALVKIARSSLGSRVDNASAPEASHLFFGNVIGRAWLGLLASHPPVEDRIRAIDPSFLEKLNAPAEPTAQIHRPAYVPGFAPITRGRKIPIRTEQVIERVGQPSSDDIGFAGQLLGALPQHVAQAAHDPYSARALVFCLLLGDDPSVRQRQLHQLGEQAERQVYDEVLRLAPAVRDMGTSARLPLLDLSIAPLRALSSRQMQDFFGLAKTLTELDRRLTLFEYALHKVLSHALLPSRPPAVKYVALKPMLEHVGVLLSALAQAGDKGEADTIASFRSGLAAMEQDPAGLMMTSSPSVKSIDLALNQLAMASPGVKRRIISGCAAAVSADQLVQAEEAELLRAIAAVLDCPIPPLVGK